MGRSDRHEPGAAAEGTPELVALTHRIAAAFNGGGFDAAAPYFAPDVEVYDPDMPPGTRLRGREAVLGLFREIVGAFHTMRIRELEMHLAGDRVLSLVHIEGAGEGSLGEMRVDFHSSHVATFRDGMVAYLRIYHDTREALQDLGLDPDDPGEPYRYDLG